MTESSSTKGGTSTRALRYGLYFVAAVLVAWLLSRRSSGPEEGIQAAGFELPLVSQPNATFRLADQRGKPVVIEVFASWCSACRSAAPTLAAAARAKRKREVRFVGISVDESFEAARRVQRAWGIPYDVVLDDGTFTKRYDISLLPTFVVIDAQGTIRHVANGAPRRSTIEEWLADVGAEQVER